MFAVVILAGESVVLVIQVDEPPDPEEPRTVIETTAEVIPLHEAA